MNIHLKYLIIEGKQEENYLTLHTLKCSIPTTKMRTMNKAQWKNTLGNKTFEKMSSLMFSFSVCISAQNF